MTEDSAFEFITHPVTSPTLPANEGIVHTPKQFSDALTLDLTDEEITRAFAITTSVSRKWRQIFAYRLGPHSTFTLDQAMKLVDNFEDELKTQLAEKLDILAQVDVTPVIEGQPPVVEILGALPSHSSTKYGLDHEKKTWEVKKAKALGQDFLGSDKLE